MENTMTPTPGVPLSAESVQERVEKIVREDFYGGPLSGSTARLASALIRAFRLTTPSDQGESGRVAQSEEPSAHNGLVAGSNPAATTTPASVSDGLETAKLAEIISDDEITRVHANANFGSMSPREVVSDGVRKTAVGYHCGCTQFSILREHGLITKPRPGTYDADLTKKGKKYARALWHIDKASALVTREAAEKRIGDLEAELADVNALRQAIFSALLNDARVMVAPGGEPDAVRRLAYRANSLESQVAALKAALEKIAGYQWPVIVGHTTTTSIGQATGEIYENKWPVTKGSALDALESVKTIARQALALKEGR